MGLHLQTRGLGDSRSLFSSFSSFRSLPHLIPPSVFLSLPHSKVFNIKVHCLTTQKEEQGGFCWIFLELAGNDKNLSTLVQQERKMYVFPQKKIKLGRQDEERLVCGTQKRFFTLSICLGHRFETE